MKYTTASSFTFLWFICFVSIINMLIRSFNLLFCSTTLRVPKTINNHKWEVYVKVIFKICSVIDHYDSHHYLFLDVFKDVIVKQKTCFHFITGHVTDCKVVQCTLCYIYHSSLINFIQFVFTIVFVAINFKFNLFPKLSTNSSITFLHLELLSSTCCSHTSQYLVLVY